MGSSCTKPTEKYRQMGYAEVYAGKTSEFENNENFKEVIIGQDFSVLVAKIGGKYKCIGGRCPHAGGPLGQGFYEDGRIYCPWHGSCYDFETGDIEEFPGLDCVPKYPATSRNGKVYVYVNTNNIQMEIMKPMSKLTDYTTRMAIIGGGPAGYMCAQTLRQEGYTGMITMFTKEPYLPYDRTKLSKELDCKWKDIKLRGKEFYLENDIEVRLNTTVKRINFFEHKVYTGDSETSYVSYDALFIAVGNRPSQIMDPTRGYTLKNITTLHDLEDAKFISANVEGKKLLIVGSSFLAMELVTMLKDTAASIDILSRQKCPYRAILGGEVGSLLLKYLQSRAENNNIRFHESNDVHHFKDNGRGEVGSCVTINKEELECDFVILANGVMPNTRQFEGSKLALDIITEAIIVNKFLETNIKHTFAGGDCCRFPLTCAAQNSAVIEHWQVALTHGRVAALNMMNENQKISISDIVPFYWTVCGDLVLKYCGHGQSYNEILLFGSLQEGDEPEFCAIYRRGIKIVAACAANCDPLIVEMSVALQSQPEWESEFPECLTRRFPDKPRKVLSSFGIRPDFEHDLIKSDLEVAFFQALSYDRVEAPRETFVPIKSNLLDIIDDIDLKPKGAFAVTEADRIEALRKKKEDYDTMEITLGLETKIPITEFGEDEGIPKLPQTYVNTKEYLSRFDKKPAADLSAYKKLVAPTVEGPPKRRHRIDSVPRFQRTETGRFTPSSSPSPSPTPSPVRIRLSSSTENLHVPTTVDKPPPESNLLALPRQHVKAKRRLSPSPKKSTAKSPSLLRGQESPKMQGKAKSEADIDIRRGSFRSELAGITGKPAFNPRAVRSVPSMTALQVPTPEAATAVPQQTTKIGIITVFPEREPIVDPFLDTGTPKKILIPQSLSPSVENELHGGLPDFLKPGSKRATKPSDKKLAPGAKEPEDHLHDKPNYKRLANKDTTPVAKLVMKQYPEITRARAHLSQSTPPILETYPPNTTMTPLLTRTPSQLIKQEIDRQGHLPHHHGISINNPHITLTKRINYDFEK